MQTEIVALVIIIGTIGTYLAMNILYVKYNHTLLLPLLTSTVIIITLLIVFRIPYGTYMIGAKWIELLLGPAIVALAVPLYKQRIMLKQNLIPVISGIIVGVVVGMVTGVLFAKMMGFSTELTLTILPKSITTPIAMQITSVLGGIPSLTAIFVMIAGFTGVILGPYVFKKLGINTPIGRGIGLGAGSHGIGTSKALEYGEKEASMSSVAMTLSAIVGSILGPLIAWLFQI
ncbi:LrgB family protein [Sporosarcina sp. CAU 1771]